MNKESNSLYTGDCLHVLKNLDSESVDLIYLDPPFNSKKMYHAQAGSKSVGASFKDVWSWKDVDSESFDCMVEKYPYLNAYLYAVESTGGREAKAYTAYMWQRVVDLYRVLKPTGSFYLHCDAAAAHYLKIMCDGVFGVKNFRNEIVWLRTHGGKTSSRNLPRNSDTIFRYTKSDDYTWNPIRFDLNDKDLAIYKKDDHDGRGKYCCYPIRSPSYSKTLIYDYVNNDGKSYTPPPNGWRLKESRIRDLENDGRLYFTEKCIYEKAYMEDRIKIGKGISNIWSDIPIVRGLEKTGYPTQKPIALLSRIIESSSKEGDVVLDPFCGCGTACIASQRLNRRWIGIDISEKAKELVTERVQKDAGLFSNFVHY